MFLKIVLSNINIKNTWKTLSTNIFIIQCDNIYNKLHSDLTNPPISFKHKQFFSPWKNGESNKTGNKIQISIDKHPMKSAPGKEEIIFLIDLSIEISQKKKQARKRAIEGTWQPSITDPSPIHGWILDHRAKNKPILRRDLENSGKGRGGDETSNEKRDEKRNDIKWNRRAKKNKNSFSILCPPFYQSIILKCLY